MKKHFISVLVCYSLLLHFEAQAQELPATTVVRPSVRVVMVENREATSAFQARPEKVREMVNQGITKLSGAADVAAAWKTYVTNRDVVGIKVYSTPGADSGTRPAVVEAVVEGLLGAGISSTNIIIWDKRLDDLRKAGFVELARRLNVRAAGAVDIGYDEQVFYDNSVLGTPVWGDLEFGRKDGKIGRKSYVTKLLTKEVTKIINIAPLLNHNVAGVSGCLCSLALGSVDNSIRFELQADRIATAVPEIYALPALSDHVVLNIMDALISQYEGEQVSLLHYATELNQLWFSKDPVALDSLAIMELSNERQFNKMPPGRRNASLYENAALLELGVCDLNKLKVEMVR